MTKEMGYQFVEDSTLIWKGSTFFRLNKSRTKTFKSLLKRTKADDAIQEISAGEEILKKLDVMRDYADIKQLIPVSGCPSSCKS